MSASAAFGSAVTLAVLAVSLLACWLDGRGRSLAPRRKPTATELADLRETGIDPHWQEVRRTLAAMQAKDITEDGRAS